jgi:hypothetical protein
MAGKLVRIQREVNELADLVEARDREAEQAEAEREPVQR